MERWHLYSSWYLPDAGDYTVAGPRVAADLLDLGIITNGGAAWLAIWFEKNPGVTVVLHRIPAAMQDQTPYLLETVPYDSDHGPAVRTARWPSESFGQASPEAKPAPERSPPKLVELVDEEVQGQMTFFATIGDLCESSTETPGEALARLGKKLDAQLARDAWKVKG